MGYYLVDLWLDGYDNDEDREKAELEFIKEQLDMCSSSVKVAEVPEKFVNELNNLMKGI